MARRRRPSHRTWRLVAFVVAASMLAAALPVTASADDGLPPAVAQYVEMVLTATGSKPPSGATGRIATLTKAGEAALEDEPAPVAEALKQVATSESYGAPVEPPARKPVRAPAEPPARKPKPPGTATDALGRPEVQALAVDDPHVAAAAAGALSRDLGATRTVLVLAFLALVFGLLVGSWVRGRPGARPGRT